MRMEIADQQKNQRVSFEWKVERDPYKSKWVSSTFCHISHESAHSGTQLTESGIEGTLHLTTYIFF